ncbi:MAG: hypothetical protein PHU64_00015 [Candidatus Omnitrophica bacterium]|nr:hypothetical protein [Candidatus Omnitrophota bacterium]MDD5430539.1 hypothetical protein [Candidatus Omnitrophota bacterium]
MKSFLSNFGTHRLTKFREIIAVGSFCVLLVLGLAGCVTMATNPGVGFTPNEQEGIIFGQMQLLVEGNLVRYDTRAFFGIAHPQMIQTFVSPYTDDQSVNVNWLLSGKLAFKTQLADEGYFSAKLPVGRYYVSDFGYFLPDYLPFPKGWRTYMPFMGTKPSDPKIVIFDVLPNQATYIGTFIHRSDTGDDRKTVLKLRIVDEYEQCKAYFLGQHSFAEGLAVSKIATFTPFRN